MNRIPAVVLLALIALSVETDSTSAAELTLLGSPAYQPSAEQPIGWRGDGTGRYPAATPPLEWYRRPKGVFNSLRVQASRPKGKGAEGQPLNMGTVREWLVVGPFEAKDHATALEDVTQPNEADLEPADGDKLAGQTWKKGVVSLGNQSQSWGRLVLDLALAYGKDERQERQNHPGTLEPVVAYACTYLYAEEAGQVRMRLEAEPALAWLNGTPLKIPKDAAMNVELKAGWNRLLVKLASTKKNWHMTSLIYPATGTGYETKNIRWMAPMPGPSWSSPIIVGSKLFVNADDGLLVCLDKESGKTLWTRGLTFYDGIDAEEREKFPTVAAKVQQLGEMLSTLPTDLNAALGMDGSKVDGNVALHEKFKKKTALEQDIRQTMAKEDKKYSIWSNDRGWTTATPISDGKYVYVSYFGGQKGIGANVVGCFDLDGKYIWSYFTGQTNVGEHGQHSTPALCGDSLVYISGSTLFAFEKTTGKVIWKKKSRGGVVTGASLVPIKVGKVDAVIVPQSGIFRVSDGEELWHAELTSEIVTPVVIGGIAYGTGDTNNHKFYFEWKVPTVAGDKLKPDFLVKQSWKEVSQDLPGSFTNSIIGSPLVHEGLCYIVSEGGLLTVLDTKTGKAIYNQTLESLNPRLTWVFSVGICTGPTLAGKYIHIRDDQAQTLVIAPGREYKELAKNVLWELMQSGNQQEAQSNPIYEGSRIFYRTQGFLYCIGEDK